MPAVTNLKLSDLAAFSQTDDVVVVGVFPPGSSDEKVFQKVAESLRNEHTFASMHPGIHVFKKFDEGFSTYQEKTVSEELLEKWISTESTPLMGEVTPDNYGKYMAAGLPMAYLFYDSDDTRKKAGAIVEEAVGPYKGKINAVYIDAQKFEAHAKALALPAEKWPGFVIHEMDSDLKYPFVGRGELNKENVSKFLADYVAEKVEPTYRSEEIPEKDEGAVKTVVYKNFEKVVMDAKKDVLLELYAPWCGACKRIAPTYERLAKAYVEHSDKFVVAKMDGTANDLPKDAHIKLTKFPTIILFKAGAGKEQVEFEKSGDSVETFVEFLTQHATNKVKVTIPKEEEQGEQEEQSGPTREKEEL